MVVQAHVKPAHAGRDPLGRSESDGGLNGNASAVTAVVDTSSSPLTWLALAAGWSGGPLSAHPKALPPVPPYLTARPVASPSCSAPMRWKRTNAGPACKRGSQRPSRLRKMDWDMSGSGDEIADRPR
jgi:hypothetical protein